MKKIRNFQAALLLMAMMAVPSARAENSNIHTLFENTRIPQVTHIRFDYGEAEDAERRHFFGEIQGLNGERVRADFSVTAAEPMTEEDWKHAEAHLLEAARSVRDASDSETWAKSLNSVLRKARRSMRFTRREQRPAWAKNSFRVTDIAIQMPYYPRLEKGIDGEDTRRLQETLILLGYLDGEADGFYGEKTATAVKQLERHIRRLEQERIDAAGSHSEPATPADGIADAPLQAYLYGSDFRADEGRLTPDSKGEAVERLQRRLIRLGYLNGAPDGHYGAATVQAVQSFRRYHGMEARGTADEQTQSVLFSENSRSPRHSVMAEGAGGDRVKDLQKRLKTLGFFNGTADGDYGAATVRGVKALQRYAERQKNLKLTPAADNGIADPILLEWFYSDDFPAVPNRTESGAENADVTRIQRRLNGLEYYYGAVDGAYGYGTENAVRAFQKQNDLEASGIAGEETLETLFSEEAKKSLKPYLIKISTKDQRVYVYGLDDQGEHTRLVRTMKCSTGKDVTPTPKGTYQGGTGPGARWHYFKKFGVWAQYAYYIEGDIMFHSVLHKEKGGPVTQSSVNNLGRKASHGCVRLSVEDAKWLYQNCPRNTKIIVY